MTQVVDRAIRFTEDVHQCGDFQIEEFVSCDNYNESPLTEWEL